MRTPTFWTRRAFLEAGGVAAAAALTPKGWALPAPRPALRLGLQLYSVRKLLAQDYAGTLSKVASIGYTEVEAAGFYGHTAAEVKKIMSTAGLRCVSAHYPLSTVLGDVPGTLAYAHELGLDYLVCSVPWTEEAQKRLASGSGQSEGAAHALTLDDWRWNAGQFNQLGKRCRDRGLKFAYHNHTPEFRHGTGADASRDGEDVLLSETDPAVVSLELDCGWATAAGADPVALLKAHPGRFSMLHVKDLKPAVAGAAPDARVSTVVGEGVIDYKPILQAASEAGVKQGFVEQEEFDGEPLTELAADYRNLRAMMMVAG